jgi:hypothetical protein
LLPVPLPGVPKPHPRRSEPHRKSRNRIEVGPVCPEHPPVYPGETATAKRRDAPDDALTEICLLWPDLPVTTRRQMLRIAKSRRKHRH